MARSYTKTGDQGTTSTLLWGRRSKAEGVFDVIGTLDELNCFLGLAASQHPSELIGQLQNDVFNIGYHVVAKQPFNEDGRRVAGLEREMDRLDAGNAPLHCFILPGGSPAAATLHCCRAICRRAERLLVRHGTSPAVLAYLNRLSDLLFVLARHVNTQPERYWQRPEGIAPAAKSKGRKNVPRKSRRRTAT